MLITHKNKTRNDNKTIIKQIGANMRSKELAKVISQECIGTGVYSMWIETKAADTAVAGQFISVYCNDKTKLLPRPISICQVDKANGSLRIVYRVVGGGTTEMSAYKAGDSVAIIGPLGNGFMQREGKKAILIGGGIGIPPMVQLATELKARQKFRLWQDIVMNYSLLMN